MEIAYIYDAVYPWVKGGGERRVYEISKRLAERGHVVHWFGLQWWEGPQNVEHDGIYLHGVGKWRNLYTNGRRSISEGLYFGLKTLAKFGGKFDVVDCQQFPYFSCLSARVRTFAKFVITWHEIWQNYWLDYLGLRGVIGVVVEKLMAKTPHVPVAVSEKTKRELIQLGVSREIIKVVPNGVDYYKIDNTPPREEKFDVVYVGRLVVHKNVDVLLRAIAQVKKEMRDVKCLIIGDGPERANLEKLSKELGIGDSVTFLGFLNREEEVYSYMKSSKIFVLPSAREGFSITTLEANAAGLPAIVTRGEKNAAVELIKNGENGYVINPTPFDLASKMLELLRDENTLKKLSENAKKFAERYDWNNITKTLEETYRNSN